MEQSKQHRILIAGATGLIGRALVKNFLKQGVKINFLTTAKTKIISTPEMQGFYWNPMEGEMDKLALDGVDAIINLAGSPIDQRWTDKAKHAIYNSRISSNETLFECLREVPNQVKQLICASAIGIYPTDNKSSFDESFETEEPNGFLQSVVAEWEASTRVFESLDIPTARIRIGLVLSNEGGVLKKLKSLAQWGVLSPMGSGNQWQSWIHIDDLVRLFNFTLDQQISGAVNAVAPEPVTNQYMINAIAGSMGRKVLLPAVPSIILKIVLGDMSEIILNGQKVEPKLLLNKGFEFDYQTIDDALSHLAKIQK